VGRVVEEQRKVNEELVEQLAKTKVEVVEGLETIRLVRRSTAGSLPAELLARGKRRSGGSSVADSGYSGFTGEEDLSEEGSELDFDSSFAGSSRGSIACPRTPGLEEMRLPPMVRLVPTEEEEEYDGAGWGAGPRYRGSVAMRKEVEESGGVWGTVQNLRHENTGLKLRVESLQAELQGCIEFVEGVGMF
jgi:hypothetical protein